MSAQLELRPDWSALWEEKRRSIRRMAEAIGLKEVGFALDVSPSGLTQGLDETGRNLPCKWEDWILAHAPAEMADEFIRRMAALRGLEVVERQPLSPAEELTALQAALREELGAGARTAITNRAAAIARDRKWSTR